MASVEAAEAGWVRPGAVTADEQGVIAAAVVTRLYRITESVNEIGCFERFQIAGLNSEQDPFFLFLERFFRKGCR